MNHIAVGPLAVWENKSPSPPQGRILLIHGICEHSGRHLNTIESLNKNGFDVVRFDLRGSGQSGGKRQHIEKWDDYISDVIQVFHWIGRTLPPLPLFVLGHSMGGAIAAYFAKNFQKDLSGLILSAPAYKTGSAIAPIKIAAGKVFVHFIPTLKIPASSDQSAISRDSQVVESYQKDPFSFHFNTLKQGDEVLKAIEKMPQVCSEITLPTFFVHGTSDRLIKIEGSFELIRKIKGLYKTFYIIPNGYHEPHNDLDKKEYFIALNYWVSSVLKTKQSEQ